MIQTFVFLLLALCTLISVVGILIAIVCRRKGTALAFLSVLVIAYATYFAALVGVSFASHNEEIAVGQEKCFDDWCVTVAHWEKGPIGDSGAGAKPYFIVTLRIANKARGVDMTPDRPRVAALDDRGNSYPISAKGQEVYERINGPQTPIGKFVTVGESFTTTVVFDALPDSTHPSFYVAEGSWPTQWIISDENSYFHAKRVTPLY